MSNKLKYLILATRPKTLPASLSPVLVGISYSYSQLHTIDVTIALLTALGALLLQISTNLVNDYYDYKRGTDKKRTLGPRRVTQSNLLSENEVRTFFFITFTLALFVITPLFFIGKSSMLYLAISCFLAAFLYTGGPLPLSYIGLGEVLAFIFFGPLACWGVWMLQSGQSLWQDFIHLLPLSSAIGAISAQIMAINNLRDINSDRDNNKKTFAVLFGYQHGQHLIILLLLLSILLPIIYFKHLLACTLFFPPLLFIKRWRPLLAPTPTKEFNDALAATGQYMFLQAIVISLLLLKG